MVNNIHPGLEYIYWGSLAYTFGTLCTLRTIILLPSYRLWAHAFLFDCVLLTNKLVGFLPYLSSGESSQDLKGNTPSASAPYSYSLCNCTRFPVFVYTHVITASVYYPLCNMYQN